MMSFQVDFFSAQTLVAIIIVPICTVRIYIMYNRFAEATVINYYISTSKQLPAY